MYLQRIIPLIFFFVGILSKFFPLISIFILFFSYRSLFFGFKDGLHYP